MSNTRAAGSDPELAALREAIAALPKQHAVVNMDDPPEWWIDVVDRAAVLDLVDSCVPDTDAGLRSALERGERAALDIVHPFDHPRIHRVFQDLRAALPARSDAGLREALERTLGNFELLLSRKPVRDATETIAEARAALAAADKESGV